MESDAAATTSPRRGRRPGASSTRQDILTAARARFAAEGFASTTIRKIAADAHVDVSLVMQYFRSKDDLFAAVMSISPEALDTIARAFAGPVEDLGVRVVRAHLKVWEGDSPDGEALRAMLRGAIVNDQANAQLREFLESRVSEDVSRHTVSDADSAVRVALASTMLIGLDVGRQIVGVPVLVSENIDSLVARVGPAIQEVLVPSVS